MPATEERQSAPVVRYPDDPDLLAAVLRVYRPHCRYLRSAVLAAPAGRGVGIQVGGEFEIGESCYIDDTGHFNAVEFNICYNQLAYFLIAKSIKERLLPDFDEWVLGDFWCRQLPDILITDLRSSFRRRIRGRRFSGSVQLTEATPVAATERWNALIVLRTTCEFGDEDGVSCTGDVKLAVTNPV
jgi:hypothetical protein